LAIVEITFQEKFDSILLTSGTASYKLHQYLLCQFQDLGHICFFRNSMPILGLVIPGLRIASLELFSSKSLNFHTVEYSPKLFNKLLKLHHYILRRLTVIA
jgi:hypothetical protein